MNLPAQLRNYPLLIAWAIICFIPALFFYYVGEEGVYTLNSLEMWQHQEFTNVVMYGNSVGGRPPMVNWLMMPVALIVGWENILIASRIVTLLATLGTALIIAWLAQQLWRDKVVSWTAGLLYLVTGDVLLHRGWLAYADPLFSLFIVLSIALVWVACIRKSSLLLWASAFAAFAAFLTKAFTVYVFVGIAVLVLCTDANYRRFLLRPQSVLAGLIGLLLPVIWLGMLSFDAKQSEAMSDDILAKLKLFDIGHYLLRLVAYPAEVLVRLMPTTLVIGYFLLRKRETILRQPALRMLLLIALLNFLPYWLAPDGRVRYVMPLYPFIVLAAAYLAVQATSPFQIKKWIVVMLVIGTVGNFVVFPYYQKHFRGENHRLMAQQILDKYGQYPLYVTDDTHIGLAISAYINTMRLGHPALTYPPAKFDEGIVIAREPEPNQGQLLREISINGESVYLMCRGAACGAAKN